MTELNELRKKAEQLKNAQKYAQAISLFEKLVAKYEDNCTMWDLWGYAYCLKKNSNFSEAIKVCETLVKKDNHFTPAKNLLAWCFYHHYISNYKNEKTFLQSARRILQSCNQEDKYSPYSLTIFKVIDHLTKKPEYPADKILKTLDLLTPDTLDNTPYKIEASNSRNNELASMKELYYMHKTKALIKLNKFEHCVKECEEALKSFQKFHYNNDIWFLWRKAVSNKTLGKLDDALFDLYKIKNKKQEWFILKEISETLFEKNHIEKSLAYAVDACLSDGDLSKKLNLFILLAKILFEKKDFENAEKHLNLAYSIKIQNNWNIGTVLKRLSFEHDIELSKDKNTEQISGELKSLWEKLKYENKENIKGFIMKILPNGKAGFIKGKDQKTYYFQIKNAKHKTSELYEGAKVNFFIEEGFDKKKNKPSKVAVNVKISD